jgi:hypothetical protein
MPLLTCGELPAKSISTCPSRVIDRHGRAQMTSVPPDRSIFVSPVHVPAGHARIERRIAASERPMISSDKVSTSVSS